MKNTTLLAATVAVAAVFASVVGCETEKLSDTQLSISPARATIAPGDDLVLTAQGGWDYTWEILEPKYGTLSTYNGKKVTYMTPLPSNEELTQGKHETVTIQVHSASNHTATAVITVHADPKPEEEEETQSGNDNQGSNNTNNQGSNPANIGAGDDTED